MWFQEVWWRIFPTLAGLFPLHQIYSLSSNGGGLCRGFFSPRDASVLEVSIISSRIFVTASGSLSASFLIGGPDIRRHFSALLNLISQLFNYLFIESLIFLSCAKNMQKNKCVHSSFLKYCRFLKDLKYNDMIYNAKLKNSSFFCRVMGIFLKWTCFHSAYFLFAIPICGVWRSRQRGTDRRDANKDQVEAIKQEEKISEEGTRLEIIQEIINYRLEHTTKECGRWKK